MHATPPPEPPTDLPAGLSVIVPIYNSERTLVDLTSRLEPVLTAASGGGDFELILVNDGSRDGSWDVVRQLVEQYRWVRGIELMRNYGQHNALLCGLRAARFSTAVTIDDDLQNPPEEIPALLAKLNEGFDVVYGTPQRQRHGLLRDFASWMTKLVLRGAMGDDIARRVSAFRAFRTSLREAFGDYRSPFVSLDVLLTWSTTRFAAVVVRHDERTVGRSNYTVGRLVRHAIDMLTGYSILPLQVASLSGFVFLLFGMGLLVFVLVRYLLHGTTVAGFPFLASTIAILSGAQLFSIGIIGEYLARVHLRMMGKPVYSVRSMADAGAKTEGAAP